MGNIVRRILRRCSRNCIKNLLRACSNGQALVVCPSERSDEIAAILYVIWDNPSFCGIGSKGIYVHKGSGIFEFLLRCSAVVFTAGRFDNAVVTDGAVLFTISVENKFRSRVDCYLQDIGNRRCFGNLSNGRAQQQESRIEIGIGCLRLV